MQKHCTKCGKEISQNSKFCVSCGAEIKNTDINNKLIKKSGNSTEKIAVIVMLIFIIGFTINSFTTSELVRAVIAIFPNNNLLVTKI